MYICSIAWYGLGNAVKIPTNASALCAQQATMNLVYALLRHVGGYCKLKGEMYMENIDGLSGIAETALFNSSDTGAVVTAADNAKSLISTSIDNAGKAIASGLEPSCLEQTALIFSIFSAVISVLIIFVNMRTVKAAQAQTRVAQKQTDIALYPLRRKVLDTLGEDELCSVVGLRNDICFLFSKDALEKYDHFVEAEREYHCANGLLLDVESKILDRADGDQEKEDLLELELHSNTMSEDEYRSKKDKILQNANAQIFDPDDMEERLYYWKDLEVSFFEKKSTRDKTKELLREQLVEEIEKTLA